MRVSAANMRALLKSMDFVRASCTRGEAEAAEVIAGRIRELGLRPAVEEFTLPYYSVQRVGLEVLEPYCKSYAAAAVGLSGSTPPEGLTARLEYVEDALEANCARAGGRIALMNKLSFDCYRRVAQAGACAFICCSGGVTRLPGRGSLEGRILRPGHLEAGRIPGVNVSAADAAEMIRRGARLLRLTVLQTETRSVSRNVIAELPGTSETGESVYFTAHYDSVPYSRGMYDNGSGCALNLELLRLFAAKPALRTLRFVWFGSEERGMLGSKSYVGEHAAELEKARLVVNTDSAGLALGANKAYVTGPEEACSLLRGCAAETGWPVEVAQDVYSSDGVPFAGQGVPVVNFCRFGPDGTVGIHDSSDLMAQLDLRKLAEMAEFIYGFARRAACAGVFPIEREMPENMVELLDKYLNNGK